MSERTWSTIRGQCTDHYHRYDNLLLVDGVNHLLRLNNDPLDTVTHIALGERHGCAVTTNPGPDLWCWGFFQGESRFPWRVGQLWR